MALRDRFKRWILRAAVLVIGGAGVAVALLQSAQQEGLTCADAQKIVNFLDSRDSPYVIPFVDKVIPAACNVSYTPRCSRLPDGTFCRKGLIFGPKLGGTRANGTRATCDPADGQAVPCHSEDGLYGDGQYNPDDINPKRFLFRLARKLRDEGFAENITGE